tara:strand:- start:73 stop:384 length:312 start_codon:yes stop_codon:yes gene_type:complete
LSPQRLARVQLQLVSGEAGYPGQQGLTLNIQPDEYLCSIGNGFDGANGCRQAVEHAAVLRLLQHQTDVPSLHRYPHPRPRRQFAMDNMQVLVASQPQAEQLIG